MKSAKKNLFLQRWQRHCQVWCDTRSQAPDLPSPADFRRWIWQSCKNTYSCVEVSVLLCDEDEARALNRDYRGKDYATNVLSFALNEGESFVRPDSGSLNGDLVFCPQVVAREAAEQGKTLMAHYAHLTVHGTLHLMGYDHIADDEAEVMEALEIRILHQLGYANPYAQDEY